jgi:hypothetical protein
MTMDVASWGQIYGLTVDGEFRVPKKEHGEVAARENGSKSIEKG